MRSPQQFLAPSLIFEVHQGRIVRSIFGVACVALYVLEFLLRAFVKMVRLKFPCC